jgi:hypothetical protein
MDKAKKPSDFSSLGAELAFVVLILEFTFSETSIRCSVILKTFFKDLFVLKKVLSWYLLKAHSSCFPTL